MKHVLTIIFLTIGVISCKKESENKSPKLANNTFEIDFHVKATDKIDLDIFGDGIIPWISIGDPTIGIDNLIGKDEIVIEASSATLVIDYPVKKPIEIDIISNTPAGFTRKDLITKISVEYNRIYKEEEETATIKAISEEEREGTLNRNETNGKYGLWGHDLGDLDLSGVIVKNKNGKATLELLVES